MKLAVIPAREGSKRVKKKNIMDFFGKPMIAYPLDTLEKTGAFEKIHVSTESAAVKNVVESLGRKIEFMRPPELSDDLTPLKPVMKHVLDTYKNQGLTFDTVVLMLPCSPLVEPSDIQAALDLYEKNGRKYSVLAVTELPVPVEWTYTLGPGNRMIPSHPGAGAKRSQDLPKAYHDAGTFGVFTPAYFTDDNPYNDQDFLAYILPKSKAVDVDDPEDLQVLEGLFWARKNKEAGRPS